MTTETAGPSSNGAADRLVTRRQASRYVSSWPLRVRVKAAVWHAAWLLLFRPTPKPLNAWRLLLLRVFGAKISGRPFVASSAKIRMPWQLEMGDRACLAPHSEVYNLGPVRLGARCVVTQYVYLCAGTHDLSDPELPLVVGPIEVGEEAFIGARAMILPGVAVGAGAVIGAGAVVTRDMPGWTVCAGNPCRAIKPRVMRDARG